VRVEIKKSERWRPGRPLWVWFVHDGPRCRASGFTPTRKAAQAEAAAAVRKLEVPPVPAWLFDEEIP